MAVSVLAESDIAKSNSSTVQPYHLITNILIEITLWMLFIIGKILELKNHAWKEKKSYFYD